MGTREERQPAKCSDLLTVFNLFDRNQNGYLNETAVLAALKSLGFNRTHGELRLALEQCSIDFSDKKIDFPQFKRVYQVFCKQEASGSVDSQSVRTTIYQYGSSVSPNGDDTLHSVSEDEQVAFCGWLERNLRDDETCRAYFPFKENGDDLYEKCNDGFLLCKIINCSAPQTIDLRALHRGQRLTTYQVMENITLALNSARAIGCNVVNIGAADIMDGTRHLLLGLLWQIIKIGLLRQINVVAHSELVALLDQDETITEFAKLSPEQILMRWVNYHLKRAKCDARMENFTLDVKDCEVYAYLLEQICPPEKKPFLHSAQAILKAADLDQRAEMVLQNAEKLDCRVFVQPKDIVNGSMKLNLAFLANLFNANPALGPVSPSPPPVVEETREERTYRNWINSMGLRTVVHSLYGDLFCGTVIFKLYDLIKSGCVDWTRINGLSSTTPAKANFQLLENCNYMVELGQRAGFSLVGVAGSDLKERQTTPVLALLWQLMRAYTLSLLVKLAEETEEDTVGCHRARSPISGKPIISERGIIDWVNGRLAEANKSRRISVTAGFSDFELRNGLLIIDLLEAIQPGCVDFSVVNLGLSPEQRLSNAQYAITVARRIGAKIYAVPEDITEVKPRMLMTVFACLMAIDLEKHHVGSLPPLTSPSPTRISSVTCNDRTRSPSTSRDDQSSSKSLSPYRTSNLTISRSQIRPQDTYQRFVDETTLAERRATMNQVSTQISTYRAESFMVKSNPITVDIGKIRCAEKGTHYDPPQRRFFGSPPPPRSRYAQLFSSPRLYRGETAKSVTALDQIGKFGYKGSNSAPQEYKLVEKTTGRKTADKEVQCEATTWRSAVPANWSRDSKESDIFAASVRGSIRTAPNGIGRYSRMDGASSPKRRGFAAAYGEYASKTVQANRYGGSGVRRGGGGRIFMAADIHRNW